MEGILDNLDYWADRSLRAVYNELGRQIGYYDNMQDLANGRYYLLKGETQVPFKNIRIKNMWAVLVNAQDELLKKGFIPSWLSTEEKTKVVSDSDRNTSNISPSPVEEILKTGVNPAILLGVSVIGAGVLLSLLRR